jgi:4-hydroxy-3-methylbut-2-enyl diphosphate reductase
MALSAGDRRTVALGSIVHNPQAMERLREQGLGVDPDAVASLDPNDRVVITAHGAPPSVYAEAERRGLEVLDTTCPLVRRVQDAGRDMVDSGRTLVVVGHADHPEVRGVVGWAGGAHVVSDPDDVAALPPGLDVGVVVQSTFPGMRLPAVLDALRERAASVVVHDTRCPVVNQRQRDVLDLLERVDVVVVVGGRGSANTRALVERCAERLPTHHVETPDEVQREWFSSGQRIGITSGTSTPDWLVDDVQAMCESF